MWSLHLAPRMALTILAFATLLTGCGGGERPIAYRPVVDPRLKEPCPRPDFPPPAGEAQYIDLMTYAINATIWGDCNERKLIDLGKSIDGPKS